MRPAQQPHCGVQETPYDVVDSGKLLNQYLCRCTLKPRHTGDHICINCSMTWPQVESWETLTALLTDKEHHQ